MFWAGAPREGGGNTERLNHKRIDPTNEKKSTWLPCARAVRTNSYFTRSTVLLTSTCHLPQAAITLIPALFCDAEVRRQSVFNSERVKDESNGALATTGQTGSQSVSPP